MSSSDKIHLIFFNACFSYEQAYEVVSHVDAAIGMTDSISDNAACAFAAQFYSSLGFGHSVKKAFEQAKGVMMLESPIEASRLAVRRKQIYLCCIPKIILMLILCTLCVLIIDTIVCVCQKF